MRPSALSTSAHSISNPSISARTRSALFGVIALTLALAGCVATGSRSKSAIADDGMSKHPQQLPPPAELIYTPPAPEIVKFDNGLTVYLLEDHELPLVTGRLLVRAGYIYDPVDKLALASLTGSTMRSGGAGSLTGDQIDEALEFVAASVEVGVDYEGAFVDFSTLTKDLDQVLGLFSDVLLRPPFDQGKIDLGKQQGMVAIRRRFDDPGNMARLKFRAVVYGDDNPYSRLSRPHHVESMTRDDLVGFHRQYYVPNGAILGISGDFDRDKLVADLHTLLDGWSKGDGWMPEIPEGDPPPPGVYYIERDLSQTIVRIGHSGMPRHSDDQDAVEVMNRIYGIGTFTSRLGTEVRSNRGLAYSVFGAVFDSPDPRHGMALALVQTRANATGETISVMEQITREMTTDPATQEELDNAKNQLINSFIFGFSSRASIVERRVELAFDGFPDDYLETYLDRIRAVTVEDVTRVAAKYLRGDDLRILVVGDRSQFDQPLESFGPVTEITVNGPGQQ